jgi:hypothetical protein
MGKTEQLLAQKEQHLGAFSAFLNNQPLSACAANVSLLFS